MADLRGARWPRKRDQSPTDDLAGLRSRVAALEAEVQELRSVNLRLAEVIDLVQELLIPIAVRDQAKVDELVERFTKSLG